MIVSFINQKGGVGKTTLSFNFAYYISKVKNYDVLFIDTDPQQSVFNFLISREDTLPFEIKAQNFFNKNGVEKEYDFVIIDSAGVDSEENRETIRNSDIVIIPTLLGLLDIQSVYHIIEVLKENDILGYKTVNYLLFNMVAGKDSLVDETINQVRKDIEDKPIKILENYIKHSVDFNKSMMQRKSIFESEDTKKGPTAKYLREIIMEVLNGIKS